MQVSVEVTEGLERRLKVGIPADRVNAEFQTRLQKASKTLRLPGFRPGKVPLNLVKQRYGESIRQEVIDELLRHSLYEALQQQKLQAAGVPIIEEIKAEAGLNFSAKFEVYPQVQLNNFNELQIEKLSAEITEADVNQMIEMLRIRGASWEPVTRAAQEQDQLTIDYLGTLNGQSFAGGQAENHKMVLGAKAFLPDFEQGLVGAKAGEEKTITVNFPADYTNHELAGKAAQFVIKVKEVAERLLPELDEAFYKSYGVAEGGGLEQLRVQVRTHMERELKQALKNRLKQGVMDALDQSHPLAIPKALIEQEIQGLRQQLVNNLGGSKAVNPDTLKDELFTEQARKRVALGLLLSELVKVRHIKPDAERVRKFIEELAVAYEKPAEVVNWYYSHKEQLAEIEQAVLEEQLVELVLNEAQVTEKKSSYEEVTQNKLKA